MTSAEYRAIRKACGLSVPEASTFHKVAESTIVLWEAELDYIPSAASEAIKRLDARFGAMVLKVVDLYAAQLDLDGLPDEVWLIRYRTAESYAASSAAREDFPFPCHDALISRTKLALDRLGAKVTIRWR